MKKPPFPPKKDGAAKGKMPFPPKKGAAPAMPMMRKGGKVKGCK